MSDDQLLSGTLGQRLIQVPIPIVWRNGLVSFPPNSVIDGRLSTLLLNGQFLDQLSGENIVQGQSLTNPNTVSSGTTRSLVVSSSSSSLNEVTQSSILSGTSDSITKTSTGNLTNAQISAGSTNSITNNGTGNMASILITGGNQNTITASGSGPKNSLGIICSQLSSMTTVAGLAKDVIIGCQNCSVVNNSTTITPQECVVIGSLDSSQTCNSTGGFFVENSIMGCDNCQITAANDTQSNGCLAAQDSSITSTVGKLFQNLIAASNVCTVSNTNTNAASSIIDTALLGSTSCNVASSGTSSSIGRVGTLGCQTTNINQTGTQTLVNCAAIASIGGTISQSGASQVGGAALVASQNSTISNSTYSLGTGVSTNITGLTNVLAHSATATQSNQFACGTRFDMIGTGNPITNGSGYVYAGYGLPQPMRNTAIDTTLAVTDSGIFITATTAVTITLPTAASMAANFPTGSWRGFYIQQAPTATPGRLLLSGADTFKNKTGWTELQLPSTNTSTHVAIVNAAGTPLWSFRDAIQLITRYAMTVANNFGTTPPLANASLLPTSTSEANHKTLTTTTYTTFDTTTVNANPTTFTKSGAVITLVHPGVYFINYEGDIFFSSNGAGSYILRTDINNITAGATVSNSYQASGGANSVGGIKHFSLACDPLVITAPTQIALRVSQDSANNFITQGSITSLRLNIVAQL